MFSNESNVHFARHQLAEVICQLRFPEILAIAANSPVDFQEKIRGEYPQYLRKQEVPASRTTDTSGKTVVNGNNVTINHQFASADGIWRVNLTSKFISLTCSQYTRWEDYAGRLDRILAAFISVYRPAYFERIGLRYLNFFSRKELGLDGVSFSQLFSPCYLGLLAEEDVPESSTTRCTVDAEMALRGGCRLKIHTGPGMVKKNGQADNEVKFILDQDLYMPGQVPVNLSTAALQTLHSQANSIFLGAITDMLRNAMEPM